MSKIYNVVTSSNGSLHRKVVKAKSMSEIAARYKDTLVKVEVADLKTSFKLLKTMVAEYKESAKILDKMSDDLGKQLAMAEKF